MSPSLGIGRSAGLGPFALIRRRADASRRAPALATNSFTISGVTRDSGGTALAACTVDLFRTTDDAKLQTTLSDGSGNYSFTLWENAGPYYCVAYLTGTPDVAGTTVNTLTAT